uniref:Cleavage and polyadenylation specificity factor subunit 2 n=1 Tax=Glossina morsitans morsitans TaxID=37546 RepID=A0A1B0G989_GLOMM
VECRKCELGNRKGSVTQLLFEKSKNAEIAWVDARIVCATGYESPNNENSGDNDITEAAEEEKTFTLESLEADEIAVHNAVLINELKLYNFKQVLMYSEFLGCMVLQWYLSFEKALGEF